MRENLHVTFSLFHGFIKGETKRMGATIDGDATLTSIGFSATQIASTVHARRESAKFQTRLPSATSIRQEQSEALKITSCMFMFGLFLASFLHILSLAMRAFLQCPTHLS